MIMIIIAFEFILFSSLARFSDVMFSRAHLSATLQALLAHLVSDNVKQAGRYRAGTGAGKKCTARHWKQSVAGRCTAESLSSLAPAFLHVDGLGGAHNWHLLETLQLSVKAAVGHNGARSMVVALERRLSRC